MDNSLPFFNKNLEDYNKITEKINKALEIISNDINQKATQSNLARLTGVSRGTINNRGNLDNKLDDIKLKRKANLDNKKDEKHNTVNQAEKKINNLTNENILLAYKVFELEDKLRQSESICNLKNRAILEKDINISELKSKINELISSTTCNNYGANLHG